MPRYFGTDGVRGVANHSLTPEFALDLGRAVALAAREGVLADPVGRPSIVVGTDTRPSATMLEAAVVAGVCAGGADVVRAGVLPTPGVAFLVGDLQAQAGVVISASHNPAPDNGLKVFGAGGWKLSEADEERLESFFNTTTGLPRGGDVGREIAIEDPAGRYVSALLSKVGSLQGLDVVLDCAHGAAWWVGPEVLRRAGARVVARHDTADGLRINEGCGATHPERVAEEARARGVIGLTLDGDADRLLAADELGRIVDGDAIIATLARSLRSAGRLTGDAVAVTVMANQAFRRWCASEGIEIVETPVGDRYVLEAMRERGLSLGGEQSGHIIHMDAATTGDGLLTALRLLECVSGTGANLADLVPFRPMPQVLVNVRCEDPKGTARRSEVLSAVDAVTRELGEAGRVLVRPSGTEPVVRVMVEAGAAEEAEALARRIAAAIEESAG